MSYKPKLLAVVDGGTSDASLTAYAVICGGTTSTNPIQSIASVGSSTNILTSNGASALPTFQAAPSAGTGYVINLGTSLLNPTDALTYFFFYPGSASGWANSAVETPGTAARDRFYIPKSGTITTVYGAFSIAGTLGSAENCTLAIRLNNTTDTNISTTLQLTANPRTFNNTGLSISVAAGDYISVKLVCPTWVTNPTSVEMSISILVT